MTVSTRDRILDAAIELFAQDGYKGTSIVRIEQAAGLTPGSGAIYHHFPSKEAVLRAGLERQLGRLNALRDIQRILLDLGDIRAELTVLARYALAEFDEETEVLRVILAEARHQPGVMGAVVDQLISATHTGFADWLHRRCRLDQEQATTVATLGFGALFSHRLLHLLLGDQPLTIDDDRFVTTWVRMLEHEIAESGG